MKKIFCNLKGGLGNQLFQVAAAYGYSLENNYEPIFPIQCDQNCTRKESYETTILKNIKRINTKVGGEWVFYKEIGFEYNKIPKCEATANIFIDGYFQSFKYFDKYKKEIKNLFDILPRKEIKLPLEEKNLEKVSIHVRRGDYLNFPDIHPVLNISYYEKAIKEIEEDRDKMYYIFSDDIDWCKKQNVFQNLKNKIFVSNLKDYECLYMMIDCDYHIIANSSFSWWGAYLSNSKCVYVPDPSIWFGIKGPKVKGEDLYPLGWKIIN